MKGLIESSDFAQQAGKHKSDFSRRCALPLPNLITWMLNFRKGTLQDELLQYAGALHGQDTASPDAFLQLYKVPAEMPSPLANSGIDLLCGGNIFFKTASFLSNRKPISYALCHPHGDY